MNLRRAFASSDWAASSLSLAGTSSDRIAENESIPTEKTARRTPMNRVITGPFEEGILKCQFIGI